MSEPTRYLAALAIVEVLREQGSLAGSLPLALSQAEAKERALLSQLAYGTCRFYQRLHAIAQQLLNKPIRKKDWDVYGVILVGLYEISHLRTPDHAAVTSAVEAAKASGQPWAASLVNGVLRAYIRQQQELPKMLANDAEYQHNHPAWLQAK